MKAFCSGTAIVAVLIAAGCSSGGSVAPPPLPPVPSAPPVPPGPSALTLTAANLAFVASGAAAAQTFTASETGYNGAFTETDTCVGLATVSPGSATGPSAIFTVTPSANGNCTVTVHDANAQTSGVGVAIAIPAPLNPPVPVPNALAFNAPGGANAQTTIVTETGYNGALNETDTCSGIATVNASGSTGPSVSYTLTPTAAGACTVTVTDASNVSAAVDVVVSTSGVIIQ